VIKVFIIEDDEDIRQGLQLLINGTIGYECVGAYNNCEDAIVDLNDDPPDVVLMDIELPGMSGIEGVAVVKTRLPETNVLMLTNYQDDTKVFDSLCAGANGYLLKSTPPAKLLECIEDVTNGGAPMSATIAKMVITSFRRPTFEELTSRETEILSQLCQGKSYKMISAALFISTGTVHSHIKNIYRKLEVNSKSEAVVKAFQNKLI